MEKDDRLDQSFAQKTRSEIGMKFNPWFNTLSGKAGCIKFPDHRYSCQSLLKGFCSVPAAIFLMIPGKIYGLGARLGLRLRKRKSVQLTVPVVSVGNIAMGGTGKTPVCAFLAEHFAQKGKKPVILTRGYKSGVRSFPHLVSKDDDPAVCGDEPLLLARMLAGKADVVVDPVRVRSASWALQRLNPDVFILDDGFQHVQVNRNMDLVLLTPDDLQGGWNKVFPCGRWREDKKALKRADICLINLWGRDIREIKALAAEKKELEHCLVFYLEMQVQGIKNIDSGPIVPDIGQRPYLLTTGVASPQKIVLSVRDFLGYAPYSHLAFPDHHKFGNETLREVSALAKKSGIRDIICTSKDAVKITPPADLRVWEIIIRPKIEDGQENKFKRAVDGKTQPA